MVKTAFTLIELILVITIVGVLTAVAVSNFYKVGDNFKIEKEFKIINSFALKTSIQLAKKAYNITPLVYMNLVDLNEDYTDQNITLRDLVHIRGRDWHISEDKNIISYKDTSIDSQDNEVIYLELHKDRKITLKVMCDKYTNIEFKNRCKELMPQKISINSF